MNINLQREIIDACKEVLDRAYHNAKFTKREFGQLDQVIQWFDNPVDDLIFSFTISLENNGESIIHTVEYDGFTLRVDETRTTFDSNVGSDNFTSYEFFLSPDEEREEGEISNWRNNALDSLRFVDDPSITVDVTIHLEEE
tara:strand:+ start:4966 stop:5388 length:423 start_codon:yes stop_codon:yes gene_type:complete